MLNIINIYTIIYDIHVFSIQSIEQFMSVHK